MSEMGPFGAGGPFGDVMRNLARMLTTQGPVNWEIARQLATWTATGGAPEANPEPVSRVRMEELLRVAELHVTEATGLSSSTGKVLSVHATGRSDWALQTLEAWKPRFERLAGAMSAVTPPDPDDADAAPSSDPMAQLFSNLPQMLGPLLLGMQAGSMVGQLASRAMGQYELPMPRPSADELLMIPATIDAFAHEWSLDVDDVRLWVCLREVINHVIVSRPHVRARLDELIDAYVGAWEPDPHALEERLAGFDPTDIAALQSTFSDPSTLLGEMQTDEQRRLQVPLRALLVTIAGYADHIMDAVGRRLIASFPQLTEALHRRRLEEHGGDRILGQLFGVTLDAADYERGHAFISGVVERAGEDGLARLWRSEQEIPTPAELDAPGLWLARIDLPAEG
ncbi:MAG: zinc-dependent metalloprotease [Actinomycetota bacterium]|nr:zinc-dependent metalloprotease [Actinomycetota bacterium]